MRKKLIALLSVACLSVTALAFSACGPATLETFEANESKRYVEVGEAYNVPKPTALDSRGNYVAVSVTATDPNGKTVDVKNYKFTPKTIGDYTITYTVTVGEETQTKTYTLEVYDETEPLVDIDLMWYNITRPGSTFDVTSVTAKDNSGEEITPVVTCYFNGEEITPDDGVVTFSELGTYTVNVTAVDSTGNKEDRDYIVYTNVTYEDGVFVENQYYANRVSTFTARNGEKSMEIALFANQPTHNWYNDASMLGELYFYGNTEENPYTHLSYWIYFDFLALDKVATATINASWYKIEGVYDIYGNEVASIGASTETGYETRYELSRNKWYRIVTDITEVDCPHDHPEVEPITDCLLDYGLYFGLWNSVEGNNTFEDDVKVFLDDIRLIDPDNDDETYAPNPLENAKNYTKGSRLAYATYNEMVNNVATANGEAVTLKNGETELVTYNFKHGLVDDKLSKFDFYGTNALGTDTSALTDGTQKKAFANGWQIWTGNSDGFVYEVTAKETVFVDLKAQVKDVDGAEGSLGGWVDSSSSCKLRVFIKTADGDLVSVKDFAPNGASDWEVTGVLLEAGQTLYYEYSFPYQDHRNIQNPVYLNVYTATKK